MAYKGKYKPINPQKYVGDPTNVIYRSLWERQVMQYLDLNSNIDQWASEEFVIWYVSPEDGKNHRYFPDFWVKLKNKKGETTIVIVEVKPLLQTKPPKEPKRKTHRYYSDLKKYAINLAKWNTAKNLCESKGWIFKILTEKDIMPGK
jgi:hypothetical protein